MLVLVASVLAALTAVLLGGKLSRLFQVKLRGSWLPVAALGLQLLILQVLEGGPRPVLVSVHLATYVMAVAFIWLNRTVPGLLVVAAGAASNGVTIALNHGTLPASAAAMAAAHIAKDPKLFLNSGTVAHPVLGFLGDVFAWPAPLPFANVFSVGDLLIVLGAGYGAHRISGSRLPHLRRRTSAVPAADGVTEQATEASVA
ncbi:MAG TPA: DUF5317 family protein [Actinomycetes bacterium]